MSETSQNMQWPPDQFAVLQDGDGNPAYYRPREVDEELGAFIDRIATTVAVGITGVRGTAFIGIIEGNTGETDEGLTRLVIESIDAQKHARRGYVWPQQSCVW